MWPPFQFDSGPYRFYQVSLVSTNQRGVPPTPTPIPALATFKTAPKIREINGDGFIVTTGPTRLIVKNFSFGCPYAGPFKFRAQLIHNKTTSGPVHAREYNIERGKVRIEPIIFTDLLPGEAYIVCVYVGNHESGACKLATTTTQKTTEVDAESEKDFCAA